MYYNVHVYCMPENIICVDGQKLLRAYMLPVIYMSCHLKINFLILSYLTDKRYFMVTRHLFFFLLFFFFFLFVCLFVFLLLLFFFFFFFFFFFCYFLLYINVQKYVFYNFLILVPTFTYFN